MLDSQLAIAGIGSRETPGSILAEMVKIGQWCAVNKIQVRSGHAPGADQAFERGAAQCCMAYLPWSSFEEQANRLGGQLVVPNNWTELILHARQFHPTWDRLKDGARKLMARNSAQVLGLDLKSPVQAVVCWTAGGRPTGGTGQALRIAAVNNIQILNMYFEQYSTAELVVASLKEILIAHLRKILSGLSAGI